MNKKTRQFIWGLLLIIICGLAVAIHLVKIIKGTWNGGINYVLLVFSLLGSIIGANYINKAV